MTDQNPALQASWIPVPDPTKLTTDAVEFARRDIERLVDLRFKSLTELIEEKFTGRDLALTAAFRAQQEIYKQQNDSNTIAADKSEKSTAVQISTLISRIDDLKDRLISIEARTIGMSAANTENRAANSDSSARMMAMVGIAIAFAVGLAEVFTRILVH